MVIVRDSQPIEIDSELKIGSENFFLESQKITLRQGGKK
jgi:hypothetical protein